jgi:signal-transduction protein with cAMP-binding, CBS, and nucleotidyltransferase domain
MSQNLSTEEKIKFMAEVVKPIVNLLDKRMKNKLEALKAYDGPINDSDSEIKKMREIEAIKLRHEVDVLKDLSDIVQAMYPNA